MIADTETKLITFVLETFSDTLNDTFSKNLNVESVYVKHLTHLFRLVPNSFYCTDLIIINIDEIVNNKINNLDLLVALKTLIKLNSNDRYVPIAIAANLQTDPKLLREMLNTGYLVGVYPVGEDFTVEEKQLSLVEMLACQQHIPKRIQNLLNENKQRKKRRVDTLEISLTKRQQQILDLITDRAASNKLIARMLNISESTVKLHMTQLLKKYGAVNRTQLALFSKTKTGV